MSCLDMKCDCLHNLFAQFYEMQQKQPTTTSSAGICVCVHYDARPDVPRITPPITFIYCINTFSLVKTVPGCVCLVLCSGTRYLNKDKIERKYQTFQTVPVTFWTFLTFSLCEKCMERTFNFFCLSPSHLTGRLIRRKPLSLYFF